jgi:hypothetical protein
VLGEIHAIQVIMLGAILALGVLLITGRRRAVQRVEAACDRAATRAAARTAEAMQREFRMFQQHPGPDPLIAREIFGLGVEVGRQANPGQD